MLNHLRHGRGEPLVLLHGTGDRLQAWDPIIDRLARAREAIAVDLPGFGASPVDEQKPPTASGFARAVAVLLDELGIESAHVAGNSMGGWTALELAKLGRARSVTALSPAGLWRHGVPAYCEASLRVSRAFARLLEPYARPIVATRASRTVMLSMMVAHPWRIPSWAAEGMITGIARAPGFDAHMRAVKHERFTGGRPITVPVTIAFGTQDHLVLRRWRRREELPAHTRWIDLPACGHVPMWDDPDLVAAVILEGSASARPRRVI